MQNLEDKPEIKKRKSLLYRARKFLVVVLLISILSGSTMTAYERPAQGFSVFASGGHVTFLM